MKAMLLGAMLFGCVLFPDLGSAQSDPNAFPLAGDWNGVSASQGSVTHVVLHMNSTPEGKMTALLDRIDQNVLGEPAIGGSFDGSRLVLRFFYWKANKSGDLEYKVATYEAAVGASGSEMTGFWTQDGFSAQLNFKRVTWQAKVPRPAPPTIFDGDWAGVEDEGRGLQVHFVFHLHNTEDGLMALLDCPEERFKGALASKVTYDERSRQISITLSQAIFAGKMTADGKALDTSMTEPGFHFLIHFDRVKQGQSPSR